MSLVTVGDLQNYADWSFSDTQKQAAEGVIAGLQVEMETYLRRPVELTRFRDDYTVPSNYRASSLNSTFYDGTDVTGVTQQYQLETFILSLDNSPVGKVLEVTSSTPSGSVTKTLAEGTDYVVRKFGIEFFGGIGADFLIKVTYDAGLDGKDIDYFKLVILRAAIREMQNMHDDVVAVKDLETRNVGPLQTGFLDTELSMLKRWRRVRP